MADYDILVIGGGPGGYVAAIKAAKAGKKVCICERKNLGGVCLNEGCIPTKTLLKSIETMNLIKNVKNFGINIADNNITFNLGNMLGRKKSVIETLRNGIGYLLNHQNITLIEEEVKLIDVDKATYSGKTITFDNAIIATGSEAFIPQIQIEEKANIATSTDVLELDRAPSEVVVIGGGVIGVELAYYLSGIGSKITILEQMDRILPMLDEEITKSVVKILNTKGIQIFTEVNVERITENSVVYQNLNGEKLSVSTDYTLIATGRRAMIDEVSMNNVGIEFDKRGIKTNNKMQTNIPNIYAIGDVNGKMMLAHVASAEGEVAVDNICGKETVMDYSTIPSCIYINPEIACIGLTEIQAKNKYECIKIGRFPLMANGKALVEGEIAGLCKVIINDRTDEIIGFHMQGIHATDIVSTVSVAMANGMKATAICDSIFAHPTVSECVHETFLNAYGKAIHI